MSSDFKKSNTLQRIKAHWSDLARRSDRDNRPYFTDFVPQEDGSMAEAIAQAAGVTCTMWGGVKHAQRVILCFSPEWIKVTKVQFPIQCLTFSYPTANSPEHRDFLGAFMACNLKRETIGDILIDGHIAQVFVCAHVAPIIVQEIRQVGRVSVSVTEDNPVCLAATTTFLTLNGTIASLRADAVVAFVTRLSREKAVQLIRQGRLTCHHTAIETPSASMQIGDVFSVRGYGKFRLEAMGEATRKGRYHITIQKYQ